MGIEATEESTGKNVELYEHFDVFPSVKQISLLGDEFGAIEHVW